MWLRGRPGSLLGHPWPCHLLHRYWDTEISVHFSSMFCHFCLPALSVPIYNPFSSFLFGRKHFYVNVVSWRGVHWLAHCATKNSYNSETSIFFPFCSKGQLSSYTKAFITDCFSETFKIPAFPWIQLLSKGSVFAHEIDWITDWFL